MSIYRAILIAFLIALPGCEKGNAPGAGEASRPSPIEEPLKGVVAQRQQLGVPAENGQKIYFPPVPIKPIEPIAPTATSCDGRDETLSTPQNKQEVKDYILKGLSFRGFFTEGTIVIKFECYGADNTATLVYAWFGYPDGLKYSGEGFALRRQVRISESGEILITDGTKKWRFNVLTGRLRFLNVDQALRQVT